MRFGLAERVVALISLPFIAVLVVIVLTWQLQQQTERVSEEAASSGNIVIAARALLADVVDAETGMRGYAATGHALFVQPYSTGKRDATLQIARLNQLVPKNSPDVARVGALAREAQRQIVLTSGVIRLVQRGRRADAITIIASGQGKRSMDAFRKSIAQFGADKNLERNRAFERLKLLWSRGRVISVLAVAFTLMITAAAATTLLRGLVRRLGHLARNADCVGRGEPIGAPLRGTDEIATVDRAFRRMAEDLKNRQRDLSRYRLLSEVTQDAIIFVDFESRRILEANAAAGKLYGSSRSALIGSNVENLLANTNAPSSLLYDAVTLLEGVAFESEHRDSDGRVFPVEIFARAAQLEGSTALVATIRDISERRKASEDLSFALSRAVEASRSKSRFVATMSHEIRTPMNGVIGMTELLLRTPLASDQREYALTTHESAKALLSIINDILDFSKIEAGRIDLEAVPFDPADLVRSAIRTLQTVAETQALDLSYHSKSIIPPVVIGDPTRLRQILINLIGNAIKFTERGSVSVRIDTVREDDDSIVLEFSVIDTGIGVPDDARHGLFEPFVQADGTTTRRFGGTGLGLAISHQLVELMDGHLDVRKNVPNGSVFFFTARFERTNEPLAVTVHPVASLNAVRVLIVDDDAASRKTIERFALSWGMSTAVAVDRHSAIAALERAALGGMPYDIVVLDYVMPGATGLGIGAEIQSNPAFGNPTLILMTAFDADGRRSAALNGGFSAYLVKPVLPSDAHDVFQAAVYGRRLASELPLAIRDVQPVAREIRILVAEDQAINRRVIGLMLRELGFASDLVTDGNEAVAAAFETVYDVIFMDVQMPNLDGLAAARAIREAERATGRHVTIIALTANALARDREACIAAGMDDYLAKPLEIATLRLMLDRWCAMPEATISTG